MERCETSAESGESEAALQKSGNILVAIIYECQYTEVYGGKRRILRIIVDYKNRLITTLMASQCTPRVQRFNIQPKENVARFITVDNFDQYGYYIHRVKDCNNRYIPYKHGFYPNELDEFTLCRHKDWIESGTDDLAILIRSDDHYKFIKYGLIRARWLDLI